MWKCGNVSLMLWKIYLMYLQVPTHLLFFIHSILVFPINSTMPLFLKWHCLLNTMNWFEVRYSKFRCRVWCQLFAKDAVEHGLSNCWCHVFGPSHWMSIYPVQVFKCYNGLMVQVQAFWKVIFLDLSYLIDSLGFTVLHFCDSLRFFLYKELIFLLGILLTIQFCTDLPMLFIFNYLLN